MNFTYLVRVKKVVVIISLILISNQSLLAAELVLSGAYQGKDIYVQNPFDIQTKKFCTTGVYVNDRKIYDNPNISAYKIDLSYLEINDLVVIRIEHSEGCRPRIVNPHVLKKTDAGFSILTSEADHNSINWATEGEVESGFYVVEQKTEEQDWTIIDSVAAKGALGRNLYTVPAPHQNGENAYRVKYAGISGEVKYSVEMYFTMAERITFYPAIATTTLTLSDSASYIITDFLGKEVKRGEGVEIAIQDLKPGEYYLSIQNRKERFVKK
ncbi:MAG: hypothetical protein ABJH05_09100 [Fulvivirga sp.]